MTTIWQDLRDSARLLRKHPGFTLTAVAVLTLGIGVNAGIFGINGLMIRPLAGLFATMGFCSLATLAFGLWPALRLSRPDLLSSLKDHAGEISGRIAGRITVRDALVTAQLALSRGASPLLEKLRWTPGIESVADGLLAFSR